MSTAALESARAGEPSRRIFALALTVIFAIALAMRLHGLFHDLPFSFYGDELHLVKRAMAMGAGDLNPHWFNKPAFLMYMLLACFGGFFVTGAALGRFASSEEFGAYFLTDIEPFLLIGRILVAAFGVGMVIVACLIGRKAFRNDTSGLVTGLLCAVLFPMIAGAQTVKEDVPAGFLLALAILCYIYTRESTRLAPVVLAALFAGLSMGTKYYGLVALPVFCAAELARHYSDGSPWRKVVSRVALIVAVFSASFFVASPYHFIDPTFGRRLVDMLAPFLGGATQVVYNPDNRVVYERGFGSAPGALVHFLGKLVRIQALSWPLGVLSGIGFIAALRARETRWVTAILGAPVAIFAVLAATLTAYHANARHLVPILPLIVVFAYPGALAVVRTIRVPARAVVPAALALVAVAAVPTTIRSIQHNQEITRVDSRVKSHQWVVENMSPADRILLDEDGPILQPNLASVARQEEALRQIGSQHPFTRHQAQRLDLLRRYPAVQGLNVDELGHQWWLNRETTDEELRTSPRHLHMGNPLISRQPKSIAEYRAAGYRYIITNSMAQRRYQADPERQAFPSFVRMYDELRRLRPMRTFDPADWNGKGPIIWIYDLEAAGTADRAAVAPAG